MGPSIIQILKAISKFEEWQDDFENNHDAETKIVLLALVRFLYVTP